MNEHSSELSTLRLSAEEKEALHNDHNQGVLNEHLDLREQVKLEHL
jgi:hypothetical protein